MRLGVTAVLCLLAPAAFAGELMVEAVGAPILTLDIPDEGEWCLRWNHSVTGGPVADCFVNDGGRMVLARSYLHDYAAGLGEVVGRGTAQAAKGGGYWIENIDEAIPDNRLHLRVGQSRVDHRITANGKVHSLSGPAAGRRVTLHLVP